MANFVAQRLVAVAALQPGWVAHYARRDLVGKDLDGIAYEDLVETFDVIGLATVERLYAEGDTYGNQGVGVWDNRVETEIKPLVNHEDGLAWFDDAKEFFYLGMLPSDSPRQFVALARQLLEERHMLNEMMKERMKEEALSE